MGKILANYTSPFPLNSKHFENSALCYRVCVSQRSHKLEMDSPSSKKHRGKSETKKNFDALHRYSVVKCKLSTVCII